MDYCQILDTKQKAFAINMDQKIYGAFAEIGAGQEVARYFFQAGGAAGTIAKTISAYDMAVSDAVYGKEQSGRYVCESRLQKMLEREFGQLLSRLVDKRPKETRFFAFANTVAARSFITKRDGHGWMGVRFQHEPQAEPSDVVIHIRLLDNQNTLQQQAIGRVGVNLIHACYNNLHSYENFVCSLLDNLTLERLEIDMIRVRGPAFDDMDVRLLNLELIKRNFSQAVIFDSKGIAQQPSDLLYKKSLLVVRGSYRPPTLVNLDMLEQGRKLFEKKLGKDKNMLILPEISTSKLVERGGEVDSADFLARVDLLQSLGYPVLITNKEGFHALNSYLEELNRKSVAFVMGIYNLESILDDKKYQGSDKNILRDLGNILGRGTELYIYPAKDEETGDVVKAKDSNIPKAYLPLLDYLVKNEILHDMEEYDKDVFHIWSRVVLKMIQSGEKGWQKMVPESVAKTVKEKKLFGHKGK